MAELNERTEVKEWEEGKNPNCPSCGSKLIFAEGCTQCKMCGWSTCSIG